MDKQYWTPKHDVLLMKEEARHRTPAASELLKGELCTILDTDGVWSHIVTEYDNYEGYVLTLQLKEATQKEIEKALSLESQVIPTSSLYSFISEYYQTPYLRAGRTIKGIDCSGLVQAIGKHFGYRIARDSYQQAEQGETVSDIAAAKIGDFVFFGKNNNGQPNINHVGMMLSSKAVLHSSEKNGGVYLDKITSEGIINSEKEKTHELIAIRRVLELER